ncbi:Cytochrome c551 peroxidase precursor [Bremerella volcania]|uniref:Methylamine utilization protein MauG n=1 Tax=Bremerella volcania TaxID=2527984 RepID=A0A518C416_9BACT|nr:cytochrome c peroxidase [Bremerella volcania]QDU73973.1 Cytochrome c551 peroxidase precursor [Bremerella volcania]
MLRLALLSIFLLTLRVPGSLCAQETYFSDVPLGIDWIIVPQDNPMSAAKVELGKQLFFDVRLSGNGTLSCASCHDPNKGWADDRKFSPGAHGQFTTRNVPSVVNVGLHRTFFWDGRAASLEEQALVPMTNPAEMDISLNELENRLRSIDGYRLQFEAIFADGVTSQNVARCLASFQRTLVAGETAYDRFRGGHADALEGEIGRGSGIFFGKANCGNCHIAKIYTDHKFHNIGTGIHDTKQDRGLAQRTGKEADIGKFRTPLLRDLALTAPYFHDGSKATLQEVVDFYNEGGGKNANLDPHIVPLQLTPEEKKALVTFLREGLRSNVYPRIEKPQLPK